MKTFEQRFKELDTNNVWNEFDLVEPKLSERRRVHAFILLDKLVPGKQDIIAGAEHDILYLDFDLDKLNAIITDEQILDLIRCGVHLDSESDSLAIFC